MNLSAKLELLWRLTEEQLKGINFGKTILSTFFALKLKLLKINSTLAQRHRV